MDRDSFIVCIKINDTYKDIPEYVETWFYTSNFELDRPLSRRKNKKVIALMKDEIGGKILNEFLRLRVKTCSYLIDEGNEYKKAKGIKKYVIKRKTKNIESYGNCLEATQVDYKINYPENNKINIISLS